jgi:hypothetical protein
MNLFNLEKRKLEITRENDNLLIDLDEKRVFEFELYQGMHGFSIAYERIRPDERLVMLPTGINPDDPTLPEPKTSQFRRCNINELFELTFEGKIPFLVA